MKLNYILMLVSQTLLIFFCYNSYSQSWLIGGNNVASGTTANDIGSLNNRNVDLITNGTVRIRIQGDGDIGIGTTAPMARLDVAGDAIINGLSVGRGGGDILYNTAHGYSALYSNTTGSSNTAIGRHALYSNTSAYGNTAIGSYALGYNTLGSHNTANGESSLFYNTTGSYNTVSGATALLFNTTGSYNTANGYSSGSYNEENTFCSYLGYDADQSVSTDFDNSMALGNTSRITASNQVRIGNSTTTSIGGYEPWTNLSDGRY